MKKLTVFLLLLIFVYECYGVDVSQIIFCCTNVVSTPPPLARFRFSKSIPNMYFRLITCWVVSISLFRQTICPSARVYLPTAHNPRVRLSAFVMCVLSSDGDRRPSTTANTFEYHRQPTCTPRRRPHRPCHAGRGVVDRPMPRVGFRGEDVCFDPVTPPGTERQIGRCTRETIPRPWDKWAPGIDGPWTDPVSAFTLGRARTHVSVRHGRSVRKRGRAERGGRSSALSVTAPRPIIAVESIKYSYAGPVHIGFETVSFGDQLRAFFDRDMLILRPRIQSGKKWQKSLHVFRVVRTEPNLYAKHFKFRLKQLFSNLRQITISTASPDFPRAIGWFRTVSA